MTISCKTTFRRMKQKSKKSSKQTSNINVVQSIKYRKSRKRKSAIKGVTQQISQQPISDFGEQMLLNRESWGKRGHCDMQDCINGTRRQAGLPQDRGASWYSFIFDLIDVKRQHVDGIFILSLLYCLVLIYTSEPVYLLVL